MVDRYGRRMAARWIKSFVVAAGIGSIATCVRAGVPVPPAAAAIAHRVAEYAPQLAAELERVLPALGGRVGAHAVATCTSVSWDDVCGSLDLSASRRAARRCRAALSDAHAALVDVPVPDSEEDVLALISLRQRTTTEAIRLSSLLRLLSHAGCAAAGTHADEVPVAITVLVDSRLLVEAERGLTPGSSYVIVTAARTPATVVPRTGPPALPVAPGLAPARARLEALGREETAADAGLAFPAFVVEAPDHVAGPFWHPPVRLVRTGAAMPGEFVPRDPRLQPPMPGGGTCGAASEARSDLLDAIEPHAAIGAVRAGTMPAPSRLDYLVAIPTGRVSRVVILAHSLRWDAKAMLAAVADALAREGLASVGFDLPLHGGRATGEDFLVPDEPAAFHRHARQAAGDLLALAGYLRRCPEVFGLPPDMAARDVGFLGYSIGASIGVLALSVDPLLRPAVLVAPAGDVVKWQGLLAAGKFGLLRRVCVGGEPATCASDADCGAGRCEHHPGLWLVPAALGPVARPLVGDAEPLGVAAFLRPPADNRPVLLQLAMDDAIVFQPYGRRVADALALPIVPRGHPLPARAATVWTGGHAFVHAPALQAEAAAFLSRGSRP